MVFRSYVILLATCLALLELPTTSGQQFPAEPIRVGVRTLQSDLGTCPLAEDRETAQSKLRANVSTIIHQSIRYTCGGTTGWRRVAYFDMTNTSYDCPPGLNLTSYSKRTCGPPSTELGCYSTIFRVSSGPYSSVCGRVIGYQFGQTSAFFGTQEQGQTIDGYYVEGVSLTHGAIGRREHIWTFAAGLSDLFADRNADHKCPCVTSTAAAPPSFVGEDYFCESGLKTGFVSAELSNIFYPNDPLWNGEGCISGITCCEFNNPPWFEKTLPNPTNDPIELRICSHGRSNQEETPLEIIELYVQ